MVRDASSGFGLDSCVLRLSEPAGTDKTAPRPRRITLSPSADTSVCISEMTEETAPDEAWSASQSWPLLFLIGVSCIVWIYICIKTFKKIAAGIMASYAWVREWFEVLLP